MKKAIFFIGLLLFFWILNKKSKNDFFLQNEFIIRNKLKFIIDIWSDFGVTKYDIASLRVAFEYFITHPKEYNGSSVINDFWIIKGLEPESVIHDYDYITATSFKNLHQSNVKYCERLRKRNAQWVWVWGFIFCSLTIVSIFKSIKFLTFKHLVMPGIPPCGLRCRVAQAHNFLKENKKSFLIYSVFYVLAAEIISYFLRYEKSYACKIYPMLSSLEFFVLFFSLFLWNDKLRFCLRKNLAVLFLSIYYLFGFYAVLFNLSDSVYALYISVGLLFIAATTFVLSILKNSN